MRRPFVLCQAVAFSVGGSLVLAGPHNAARATPPGVGPRAITAALPLRAHGERFVLAEPDAPSSPAWRLTGELDRDGSPVLSPGYTVLNRVIVGGGGRATLEGALRERATLRGRPAEVSRAAAVRGFSIIETDSVGEAIALAEELRASGRFKTVELDLERPRDLRSLPNDPLFGNQWHLRNTQNPIADINAEDAWALGFTGQGVIIGIIESGFQITHADLAPNYVAAASTGTGTTSHATGVAGVAAARGNNALGVTGLAYHAGLARLIYGNSTQNAAVFLYRNDLTAIKNNSWGPQDSGALWDTYAASIELAALEDSALLGRNGLGTIVCWAAGNGGNNDRVDYDPYTSSRYTFAIGAIGDLDVEASYNERGSAMLAVAHSSGNTRNITTTNTSSTYTNNFGGTSAASPLAAGAIALALEANPALTWRDVQALIVQTARTNDPADSYWTVNGAGRQVNERFGFGALDAGALVSAALDWTPLPDETSATTGVIPVNENLPDNTPAGVVRTVELDADIIIESVILTLNVQTPFVGDLRITLTSPGGTVSVFAEPRGDFSSDITNYPFLSLRCWGEHAAGTWTIAISDERASNIATWEDFTLTVHGTPASLNCNPADLAEAFGILDLNDIQAFVNAFSGAEAAADLADPFGVFDLNDIQAFVNAFNTGCP
jgi:subtilisin-like proprotein convertase family protein